MIHCEDMEYCYNGKVKWDCNHGIPVMLECDKYKTDKCPKYPVGVKHD